MAECTHTIIKKNLVCCFNNGFTISNLFKDTFSRLGPDKRFRVFIVATNIFFNGGNQLCHTTEDTSPNSGIF